MNKIIRNYNLFRIIGQEFESVINFNSSTKDSTKTEPKSTETSREFVECSSNSRQTLDETENPENNHNSQIINEEERKLALARVREDKIREDKKRKNDFIIEKNDDDDDEQIQISPKPMSPYRSWRELIDSLVQESEWKDRVCMTSSFSILLGKYFKESLEIFKDHVLLHGREKTIENQEDARRYFNFYTKERHTSKELHAALLALDAKRKAAAPPDPYRYEQFVDGKRTYLGSVIPDDAPPRPDNTALWDETEHAWFSQQFSHKRS